MTETLPLRWQRSVHRLSSFLPPIPGRPGCAIEMPVTTDPTRFCPRELLQLRRSARREATTHLRKPFRDRPPTVAKLRSCWVSVQRRTYDGRAVTHAWPKCAAPHGDTVQFCLRCHMPVSGVRPRASRRCDVREVRGRLCQVRDDEEGGDADRARAGETTFPATCGVREGRVARARDAGLVPVLVCPLARGQLINGSRPPAPSSPSRADSPWRACTRCRRAALR